MLLIPTTIPLLPVTLTIAITAILPLKPRAVHRKCPDPALVHRGGEAPLPILFVAEEVILPAQMARRVVHAPPRPAPRPPEATMNYIATALLVTAVMMSMARPPERTRINFLLLISVLRILLKVVVAREPSLKAR
jgi:hypothetical protein